MLADLYLASLEFFAAMMAASWSINAALWVIVAELLMLIAVLMRKR